MIGPAQETLNEIARKVGEEDPLFQVGVQKVRGMDLPVFVNAPQTLKGLIDVARTHADMEFVVYEDERLTYTEALAQVDAIGVALQEELGVEKGERVAIAMRNVPEWMTSFLAVVSIGAVTVPLNARGTEDDIDYGLSDSNVKAVFVDYEHVGRIGPVARRQGRKVIVCRGPAEDPADIALSTLLEAGKGRQPAPVDIHPDDDYLICYTSGSTGRPKGAALTHIGLITCLLGWGLGGPAFSAMRGEELVPPEKPAVLTAVPLFHVTGCHAHFLGSLVTGRKIVLMHKWDPRRAVELVRDEQITTMNGVPTMTIELMRAARDMGVELTSLLAVDSGGAKRPPNEVAEISDHFPAARAGSGYGMTETSGLGTGINGAQYVQRPDSAGLAFPLVMDVKIVDEAGAELGPNEQGEVCLKSAANMREYINRPKETAETLKDGWVHTGDLGYVDEEGYLFIVDRLKTLIIRGGENISCNEVEAALVNHAHVDEACAFSVPDDRLQEAVGIALSVSGDFDMDFDDIREWAGQNVPPFKQPEHIWLFQGPLLRGNTEKIDRRNIRLACIEQMPEAGVAKAMPNLTKES